MLDLKKAVARFGTEAKAKLANPSATGEPDDQLRAPLEGLFADLAELCGFPRSWLTAVGESSLSTLKTRPDFAITLRKVLVGFVEVKAPENGGRRESLRRFLRGEQSIRLDVADRLARYSGLRLTVDQESVVCVVSFPTGRILKSLCLPN